MNFWVTLSQATTSESLVIQFLGPQVGGFEVPENVSEKAGIVPITYAPLPITETGSVIVG
jgi:hypothetical protein